MDGVGFAAMILSIFRTCTTREYVSPTLAPTSPGLERPAYFTGPLDRPNLGDDEAVPELQGAAKAGQFSWTVT